MNFIFIKYKNCYSNLIMYKFSRLLNILINFLQWIIVDNSCAYSRTANPNRHKPTSREGGRPTFASGKITWKASSEQLPWFIAPVTPSPTRCIPPTNSRMVWLSEWLSRESVVDKLVWLTAQQLGLVTEYCHEENSTSHTLTVATIILNTCVQ